MSDARCIVRAMTWNIHGGFGRDGTRDVGRLLGVVRAVDPDILALQEVDSRGLDPSDHPIAQFERLIGRPGIRATSIVAADGDYGQALFSRWPIEDAHVHDISVERREPRRLIEATVLSPRGAVHVLATHLGLSFQERQHQLRKIVRALDRPAAATLLLGDFNDWMWPGSVQKGLSARLPARSQLRTYPSKLPLLKLDRIYCQPPGVLLRTWTAKEGAEYSDHLPLVAELNISAPAF